MYDIIVIGAGPAGLTAGIYASRKKLKTLVVSKDLGGQAAISGDIENYLGYSVISGPELTQKFREHVQNFPDLEIKEGLEVVDLRTHGAGCFDVKTSDGQIFHARCLIIATGKRPRLLGIKGEKEFLGRGVATCAVCDAPLFKDKIVAVVGGGNSALDAILTLTKFASKVYSVNLNPELKGDETLKQNVLNLGNVEIISNTETTRVLGDKLVTGFEIKDKSTLQTRTLEVQGVFVEIGYIPNVDFDKVTAKNEGGEIIVNKDLKTSLSGVFAAGDVNDLWGEQIIIAAGEGAKAAMRAAEYLGKLPGVSPVCMETHTDTSFLSSPT